MSFLCMKWIFFGVTSPTNILFVGSSGTVDFFEGSSCVRQNGFVSGIALRVPPNGERSLELRCWQDFSQGDASYVDADAQKKTDALRNWTETTASRPNAAGMQVSNSA